jgi:hypothetical protein
MLGAKRHSLFCRNNFRRTTQARMLRLNMVEIAGFMAIRNLTEFTTETKD